MGDIHGQYEMMLTALDKARYNPKEDKLVLLGDYVDRGAHSNLVVQKVKELVQGGAIALLGNHEAMMISAIRDKSRTERGHIAEKYMRWMETSGGEQTFDSFAGNMEEMRAVTKFLKTLPLYFESKEYVFVHGAVNPIGDDYLRKQGVNTLIWKRQHKFPKVKYKNKTIVVGHTPVQSLRTDADNVQPIIEDHAIYLDTGAVLAGKSPAALTVMDLLTKEYWQVPG